jgi:competence protein ComEA
MPAFYGSLALMVALVCNGAAQSKLPEGKGRELVERECTKCHGTEGITRSRLTKERWGEVVDDMVSRGASATDTEIDQIIDYLAANFGKSGNDAAAASKVNVNKASASELSIALSVSADMGAAIVRYREKNGSFKDSEDLKKVPDIDAKRIEELKDRLQY